MEVTRAHQVLGEKAPGVDEVVEVCGCCRAVMADTILQYCMDLGARTIWLFKMGDSRVHANYRNIPGKVYETVEKKLQSIAEPQGRRRNKGESLLAVEWWTNSSRIRVCQLSLRVFCGLGENIWLCPLSCPVGGVKWVRPQKILLEVILSLYIFWCEGWSLCLNTWH